MDESASGTAAAAATPRTIRSDAQRLDHAVSELHRVRPGFSARDSLTPPQIAVLWAFVVIGILTACRVPDVAWSAAQVILAIAFAALLPVRILGIRYLLSHRPRTRDHAGAQTGHGAPDGLAPSHTATLGECSADALAQSLPLYSILIPLHDEAAVARQLVCAMHEIDYPPSALDVLFVLEAHDHATKAALLACGLPPHMSLITVPKGVPRTKPRALAYALTFARGDYVVVYDAEDAPEPGQLRAAVTAFGAGGPGLGCLQARLTVGLAAGETIAGRRPGPLAAQFAIEYAVLFDAILPSLAHHGLPVLLGGTSNHFPRHVLDATGGWDPYNVTEDADLGVRLARCGYRVEVLDSATLEDAPATLRAWFAQRTRWQKGWLQTYFVHMRAPLALWRDLGPRGFVALQIVLGGGLLCSFVHPWLYIWLLWHLALGTLAPPVGPAAWLWWVALANLAASALATTILAVLALRVQARHRLIPHALAAPLYWLPVSVALYTAMWEWAVAPHYWAKTPHVARKPVTA